VIHDKDDPEVLQKQANTFTRSFKKMANSLTEKVWGTEKF
jgi:hypothetical protein